MPTRPSRPALDALLGLAFVACALSPLLEGCDSNGQGQCYCPAHTGGEADIWLPCGSTNISAQATGVCTATVQESAGVVFVEGQGSDGQCTVAVSVGGSAPTSYQFQFATQWLQCGGDPHGCGQSTYATPSEVQIGSQCTSSGSSSSSSGGGVAEAGGTD
jgi:hypothetical protein